MLLMRSAFVAALGLSLWGAANAEPEAAATSAQATDSLEEIMVTAERRQESSREVPISVTAVNAKTLDRYAILTPQDLPLVTTSLTFGSQVLYGAPYIRGIGSDTTTLGTESSVALYVDGIYYARQYALLQNLNGVDRIEVLKGPQGALYGRNATGGAINIITKTPEPGFSGEIQAGTGNYGLQDYRLSATGGSDRIDVNFSGYIKKHAGYYTNLVTGDRVEREDDYGGLLKFLFKFSDSSRLTLSLDGANTLGAVGAFASQLGTTNVLASVFPGTCYPSAPHLTCADQQQRIIDNNWQHNNGGGARWETNFQSFDLIVLGGYRHSTSRSAIDVDASSAPIIYFANQPARGVNGPGEVYEMYSIEPQLISHSSGPFNWLLGAMASRERGDIDVTIDALNQFAQQTQNHISNHAYAGYGEGSFKFGTDNRWKVTGGVRFADEKKEVYNQSQFVYLGGFATGTPTPVATFPNQSKTWNDTLGSLSLNYDLGNANAYLRLAQGFKSGAFNVDTPGVPPVNPEKLNSAELGIKSTLAGGSIELNAAVFYYDYKDIQIEIQTTTGGSEIQNAAKAKVKGGEIDARALVTENFQVRVGLSGLNATYSSFPNASVSAPCVNYGVPAPENCTPGTPPVVGIPPPDLAGNYLPRAPRFTSNVSGLYTIPSPIGTFDIAAVASSSSNFYFDANNRLRQSPFTLVNANVTYHSLDSKWFLRVSASNLTDAHHLDYVSAVQFGDFAHWADPRTWEITAGYRF